MVNQALLWRTQNPDTLKAAQSLLYSGLIALKMTFTASHPIWMLPATTTVDSGTLIFNGVFVASAEDAPNTVIIFSIQFICCRQFNLILILLVLRLFQSFLSTLLCRIYKWNIQTLFGFFLLFLLSHTESLCLIIFLNNVMFYQDHRKYYKGCYGKLKLDICFQSLGGQFYILRVLCGYNTDQSLQSYSTSLSIRL